MNSVFIKIALASAIWLLLGYQIADAQLIDFRNRELGFQFGPNVHLPKINENYGGEINPRLGWTFGLILSQKRSRKFSLVYEATLLNTQATIDNFFSERRYHSFDYTTVISDSRGRLSINSTFLEVPLLVRYYFNRHKKYFLESGISIRFKLFGNNYYDYRNTNYFRNNSPLTEADRLANPIVSNHTIDNYNIGGEDPNFIFTAGMRLKIVKSRSLIIKCRYRFMPRFLQKISAIRFNNLALLISLE